jgi:hypothetical protein
MMRSDEQRCRDRGTMLAGRKARRKVAASCGPPLSPANNVAAQSSPFATLHTCRLGKDCLNGNTTQSNLVHYDFHKLRNDKMTCAMRLISSPQTSTSAI